MPPTPPWRRQRFSVLVALLLAEGVSLAVVSDLSALVAPDVLRWGLGRRRPSQRRLLAAAAAKGSLPASQRKDVVFNYLTQDYELARPDGKMVWSEEGGFSLLDFLPWSEADRQAMAMVNERLPNWRKAFLMPSSEAGVRRRWRVLAEVAGGEQKGLAALDRNVGILCISERTTRAASEALVKNLGREKAAEVVGKNPGVLAIKASSLQGDGLARTVFVADIIDFLVGPGRPLVTFLQYFFAVAILKALGDIANRGG